MLAGDLYIADDPMLSEESQRAMELTRQYNASSVSDATTRRRILIELLGSVGEGTEIRPSFHCDYGYQTHIGARTFVNFGLVALDVARISIGDDVQIGPRMQLLTPTHPWPDTRSGRGRCWTGSAKPGFSNASWPAPAPTGGRCPLVRLTSCAWLADARLQDRDDGE